MHLQLDQEQTRQTRLAYHDRIDALKKARKKLEDLGVSTRDVDAAIGVIKGYGGDAGLLAMVDDQVDAFEARRNGGAELEGQMSLDEALDGAEAEAKRVLRNEQRRAVAGALDLLVIDPGVDWPGGDEASEMDDQAIARWLLDAWEDVEYEVPESDELESWPGIVRHETEAGRVVWCAVATNNGVPRFWYDVDPEQFDATTLAATFQGEPLFREVRRAWGVLPEEPEPEVRVETEAEPEEEPVTAWRRRTCPVAEMDSNTSILLQGMHQLLLRRDALTGRLFDAYREGISDDELLEVISNTLDGADSASVAVNIVGQDNVEYVAVSVGVDPLQFTMKRGRKKEALKGDGALTAIRAMLEIPEPAADEPAEEPAEHETPVAVGVDDDELLPF